MWGLESGCKMFEINLNIYFNISIKNYFFFQEAFGNRGIHIIHNSLWISGCKIDIVLQGCRLLYYSALYKKKITII